MIKLSLLQLSLLGENMAFDPRSAYIQVGSRNGPYEKAGCGHSNPHETKRNDRSNPYQSPLSRRERERHTARTRDYVNQRPPAYLPTGIARVTSPQVSLVMGPPSDGAPSECGRIILVIIGIALTILGIISSSAPMLGVGLVMTAWCGTAYMFGPQPKKRAFP